MYRKIAIFEMCWFQSSDNKMQFLGIYLYNYVLLDMPYWTNNKTMESLNLNTHIYGSLNP